MAVRVEQLEGLKRQMMVVVEADAVKNAYEKELKNATKNVSVKGFRKGMVPPKVVEQKFGKSILQDVASNLINTTLDKSLEENKFNIAGSPSIHFDVQNLNKDKSFEYTATFEVYPTITLVDLSDQEIESPTASVSDEDVNGALIKLRTQHSEWQAVDRAAKLGDKVVIDFKGMLNGEPLDKGSAENSTLELGSKSMIPGFEDGVVGMKPNEVKDITLTFPEDYHVENLRNKEVVFTVTLHKIEEPKLPALDDEFAKKVGVKEGLEALKQNVRTRLESELKQRLHAVEKQNVLDKFLELNPVEVPSSLVSMEIKNLQQMTRQQMQYYFPNMSKDQIDKMPLTEEPYIEEAKKRVALGLLLSTLIKDNDIKADQDKVRAKIHELAANYPNSAEVEDYYLKNKRLLGEIEAYTLEEQAVKLLLERAKLKSIETSYDAIMSDSQSE